MRLRLLTLLLAALIFGMAVVFGVWLWQHRSPGVGPESTKIGSKRELTKPEIHRLTNAAAVNRLPDGFIPSWAFVTEAKETLFPGGAGQQTVVSFAPDAKWKLELSKQKTELAKKTWQVVADDTSGERRLLILGLNKNTVRYDLAADNSLTFTYVEYAHQDAK